MNLTYKLEGNGYVIMNNGVDWIVQDTYIPYPGKTVVESAENHIKQIIEDNKPKPVDTTMQQRIEAIEIAMANMMGGV